jgi:hypothetical protein
MQSRFRFYWLNEIWGVREEQWHAICDRDDADIRRLGRQKPTTRQIKHMVTRNG